MNRCVCMPDIEWLLCGLCDLVPLLLGLISMCPRANVGIKRGSGWCPTTVLICLTLTWLWKARDLQVDRWWMWRVERDRGNHTTKKWKRTAIVGILGFAGLFAGWMLLPLLDAFISRGSFPPLFFLPSFLQLGSNAPSASEIPEDQKEGASPL